MHRAGPLPSGTRASEPVEIPRRPIWAVARKMPQQAARASSPRFARLPPGFARCNSWNLCGVILIFGESDRKKLCNAAVVSAGIGNSGFCVRHSRRLEKESEKQIPHG